MPTILPLLTITETGLTAKVKYSLDFFERLQQLGEGIISRVRDDLRTQLELMDKGGFAADKAGTPTSTLDLILYAFRGEAVKVDPPGRIENPQDNSSWENTLILIGHEGQYALFIRNGYHVID
ncbi:MAG: hypothetical protein ABIH34_03470 [Nanoarchaeota archaeon]